MEKQIIGAMNYIMLYLAIDFVNKIHQNKKSKYSTKLELTFIEKLILFNKANNFSFYKVNLLPFFISSADANKKEELIDFFTYISKNKKFYFSPSSIGIINVGLKELIHKNDKRLLFTIGEMTKLKLSSLPTTKNMEEIEAFILEKFFLEDENFGEDLFLIIRNNLNLIYIPNFSTVGFAGYLQYVRSITSIKVFSEKELEIDNPDFARNIYSFNSIIKTEPYFWEFGLLN